MLVLKNVEKTYTTKAGGDVQALKNVNLSFSQNEIVFILGQSGSGKTTLLNLLGGIDSQSSGEIYVDDKLLGKDLSLEAYRQNYLGFVFQEYNLIDNLNVFDNIAIALSDKNKKSKAETVSQVLKKVKLEGYEKRRISELSGGQKQRVAIARALAKNAQILLCDEPTGNLDSKTSKEIFALLKELSKDKIVIVVSHNEELSKQFADRTININDGEVTDDDGKIAQTRQESNIKTIKNKVSVALKLKLSLNNLFTHKLKTFVSFILLFLSLLSVSIMQICCSYSPEQSITAMVKDDESMFIVSGITNTNYTNNEEKNDVDIALLTHLGQENYQRLYWINFSRYFVTDNDNTLLNNRQFYFKNKLDDGYAYVTDYFVDYTLQNNEKYVAIQFKEYTELNNKEVKYEGNVLYKIAGVVKTDYKQFFKDNNLTFDKLNEFGFWAEDITHFPYKLDYFYNVTYVNEQTLNSFNSNKNDYSFTKSDSVKTNVKFNGNVAELDSHRLADSKEVNVKFLGADGKMYTNNKENYDQNLTYKEIGENEIVIDCKLFNELFSKDYDWVKINRDYFDCYIQNKPFNQPIDGLNTKISISLEKHGKPICGSQEKTVIGVNFEKADIAFTDYNDKIPTHAGGTGFGSTYYNELYFSIGDLNLINTDINKIYAVEVNLKSVKNLQGLLTELRKNGNLVAGEIALQTYSIEDVTKQMGYFFIAVTVVFLLIAFFSMLNLVNTKIKDNKRQIGILMGIGFTAKDILLIFLLSIIYLLAIALIFIIPLSYVAAHIVNNLLIIGEFGYIKFFMVNIFTYLVLFAASILLVFLSSLPLILFTKKKPIDVIKDNK